VVAPTPPASTAGDRTEAVHTETPRPVPGRSSRAPPAPLRPVRARIPLVRLDIPGRDTQRPRAVTAPILLDLPSRADTTKRGIRPVLAGTAREISLATLVSSRLGRPGRQAGSRCQRPATLATRLPSGTRPGRNRFPAKARRTRARAARLGRSSSLRRPRQNPTARGRARGTKPAGTGIVPSRAVRRQARQARMRARRAPPIRGWTSPQSGCPRRGRPHTPGPSVIRATTPLDPVAPCPRRARPLDGALDNRLVIMQSSTPIVLVTLRAHWLLA
jgi:hypothetical protein